MFWKISGTLSPTDATPAPARMPFPVASLPAEVTSRSARLSICACAASSIALGATACGPYSAVTFLASRSLARCMAGSVIALRAAVFAATLAAMPEAPPVPTDVSMFGSCSPPSSARYVNASPIPCTSRNDPNCAGFVFCKSSSFFAASSICARAYSSAPTALPRKAGITSVMVDPSRAIPRLTPADAASPRDLSGL